MARKWTLFFDHLQSLLKRRIRDSYRRSRLALLALLIFLMCVLTHPVTASEDLADPRSLYDAGRYTEAIEQLQQVIQRARSQENVLQEAAALSNLALTYQQLGAWTEAEQAIAASLDLLETLSLDRTSDTSGSAVLAQTWMIQGKLQSAQGQTEEALETWARSVDLFEQISDPLGAVDGRINQAQALQALGFYQRAVDTLTEVNQVLQDQPPSLQKAIALRSLGEALRVTGDLPRSRQVLEESLAVAETVQSLAAIADAQLSLGNTSHDQAAELQRLILTARGRIARDEMQAAFASETASALEFYQQAAIAAPALSTRIQAKLNQVSLLLDNQQIDAAALIVAQIQEELPDLIPSRLSIYHRVALAQSWLRLKQAQAETNVEWRDIAELLATGAQQANALNDRRAESYAIGSLAELYEQTQQWKESQDLTEQALSLAQVANAPDVSYRWYWQLGRLLKQQGDRSQAIVAYTEAVNILEDLRGDLVAGNRDLQFSFRESVEPVYRQLVDLLLPSVGAGRIEGENLATARDVIERLQLAELDNFFRAACLRTQEVQIDQIDPQAVVIYPILLDDRLVTIFSVSEQPLFAYESAVTRQDVEASVEQLVQALRTPPDSRGHLPLAQQLYDWLIRPAEMDLAALGAQTLVFVPDSVLQNVPMATLHNGEQYLIQQYAIALTPGLELIETRSLPQNELSVLKAGLSEARGGFSSLPGVEQELSQIQTTVPSGQVLLNEGFTSEAFQSAIQKLSSPVVHLATHGQFSSQLDETFILTWDGTINVNELNNLLRTSDLTQTNPIELLVLSACQTAVGDRRAALGLAGVAVGAGARSTMATLWQVDDNATVLLIEKFYEQIAQENVTKAEALRRAQQSMLANPLYQRPYFWASFVLVGNWL